MRSDADAIKSLQRFVAGFLPEPWDVRRVLENGEEPVRPYALIEQGDPIVSDGGPNLQDITITYTINLYLPRPADKSRQTADDAALALREQVYQAVKWGPDLRRSTTDRIPLFSYEPRICVQRVTVRGATAGEFSLELDGEVTDAIARDVDVDGLQAALDEVAPDQTVVEPRAGGIFDIHMVGDLAGVDVPLMTLDASQLVGGQPGVRVILHGAPAPWRAPSDYMVVESFGQTTLRDPDDPTLLQVAVDLRCAFARGRPVPFGQMLLQRISATSSSGGM